jgi:hypothetical protein
MIKIKNKKNNEILEEYIKNDINMFIRQIKLFQTKRKFISQKDIINIFEKKDIYTIS